MSLAEQEIHALEALHPKGNDLSLDRISRLLEALDHPELAMPPVIHVAGTNGKGSTAAFCRAILEAEGYRVHVHTSPHLVEWHERYRLGEDGGGKFVKDALLAETIKRVAKVNAGQDITVFEMLTAVMFLLFSEHPADVAIVEVGLGGRFDSTNVITNPAVAIISSISLDHQAFLGDRVELIAAEKAGIIKPGCPVVIGEQLEEDAREVLISTARRIGSRKMVYGEDFVSYSEHGRLVYQDEDGLLDLPLPRLKGRHQYANAAAAIRGIKSAGITVSDASIAKGLEGVDWPGRLQKLTAGRIFDLARPGTEIWIDAGHNPGAGRVIAEAMANQEDCDSRPLFLITGMLNTKEPHGFFEAFADMARHVFTVEITTSDAGLDPVVLAGEAEDAGLSAEPAASVEAAITTISQHWSDPDSPPRILVCGSLYLIGEVLRLNGTPPR